MTTNTGGAKFIHDGMKEMGILTPAQQYAADHADTCKEDIRSAIDGLPCDLFVAKSVDEDLTYYDIRSGQDYRRRAMGNRRHPELPAGERRPAEGIPAHLHRDAEQLE